MDKFLENLKEQINEILDEAGKTQTNLLSETAREFICKNIIYVVKEYLILKENEKIK